MRARSRRRTRRRDDDDDDDAGDGDDMLARVHRAKGRGRARGASRDDAGEDRDARAPEVILSTDHGGVRARGDDAGDR